MGSRRVTLAMSVLAGFSIVSIPPGRLCARYGFRFGRSFGLGLVVISRSVRVGRPVPNVRIVSHGCADPGDSGLVGFRQTRGIRKLVCEFGGDLKARVAIENFDGADLGLRHVSGAAQER